MLLLLQIREPLLDRFRPGEIAGEPVVRFRLVALLRSLLEYLPPLQDIDFYHGYGGFRLVGQAQLRAVRRRFRDVVKLRIQIHQRSPRYVLRHSRHVTSNRTLVRVLLRLRGAGRRRGRRIVLLIVVTVIGVESVAERFLRRRCRGRSRGRRRRRDIAVDRALALHVVHVRVIFLYFAVSIALKEVGPVFIPLQL